MQLTLSKSVTPEVSHVPRHESKLFEHFFSGDYPKRCYINNNSPHSSCSKFTNPLLSRVFPNFNSETEYGIMVYGFPIPEWEVADKTRPYGYPLVLSVLFHNSLLHDISLYSCNRGESHIYALRPSVRVHVGREGKLSTFAKGLKFPWQKPALDYLFERMENYMAFKGFRGVDAQNLQVSSLCVPGYKLSTPVDRYPTFAEQLEHNQTLREFDLPIHIPRYRTP